MAQTNGHGDELFGAVEFNCGVKAGISPTVAGHSYFQACGMEVEDNYGDW